MFNKTIVSLGVLGIMIFATSAQAATVSLLVPTGSVAANEQFSLALELDATDIEDAGGGNIRSSISGEVLVTFVSDSLIINGFATLAPALVGFQAPDANSISVGFLQAENAGVIGNFTFTATEDIPDLAALSFGLSDNDDLFGTFAFENPTNQPFMPQFLVGTSVIPVPAAGWLMLSALGLLGFGARRTKA